MVTHSTDASFRNDVLEATVPVLVDFWAPWCGPCRMVAPILDKVSEALEGKAKVVKVNVDENPETATRYGITGIPTVILFKNGQEVRRLVGAQPPQVYLNAVEV